MNFKFQFSFSIREWSKTEVRTSYGYICFTVIFVVVACCHAHVLLAFVSFRVSKWWPFVVLEEWLLSTVTTKIRSFFSSGEGNN